MEQSEFEATYTELREDILREAEVSGEAQETVFFEYFSEVASENGDCGDLTYAPARRDGRGGYRIDGFALDLDRGELHLAVCDFRGSDTPETINAEAVARSFLQVQRFVEQAMQAEFLNSLEETSPAFQAAYPIHVNRTRIKRIRAVLFTNARISMRRSVEASTVLERPITYNLFDFGRYAEILKSHGGPEPIEIDIADLNGAPLPCLKAHVGGSEYQSYLVVMPGELLASIYGLYGARLLEQNVRTFLQARTKVNKGIIQTIEKSPEMFFAFNNGLTATARDVELSQLDDGTLGIRSIKDLQIVNGGQTTASILYSKDRNDSDLGSVFVQMKLSVVEPNSIEEVVPQISRFANTQNRISETDFFSSHPFHVELEKISRRVSAPPKAGSLASTKWFYERARGQYKDRLAYGNASSRKKFEAEFPKDQTLQKTDLAKYQATFDCKPHVVSTGAQKCFLSFAEGVGKSWDANPDRFNDDYFKRAIAKAIVFRWTDRMVGLSDWYKQDRGYKANIVTYTVAWLVNHLASKHSSQIDLVQVWKSQSVGDDLRMALEDIAPQIAQLLKSPPEEVRNISEYAKQQACWARVKSAELTVPEDVSVFSVLEQEVKSEAKSAVAAKRTDRSIEFESLLMQLMGRAGEVETLAKRHRILSPKSSAALRKIGRGSPLGRSDLRSMEQLDKRLRELGHDLSEYAL